jgi:hypothetical protein
MSRYHLNARGQIFVNKFGFGGSFDMTLEGDCRELEVNPNLEF